MLCQDILDKPNVKNWCSLLRNLLYSLGFQEIWYFQTVGNTKLFLSLVKQRINDQFIQNWNERLETSSRASFYRSIGIFQFQPYLNIVNLSQYRKCLSRLRLSSHRLSVETGRWHKPISIPQNERKCIFCDTLEDEYHFVLECKLYTALRKQYVSSFYWKRPNMFKFTCLMKSENEKTMKNLGIYVYKAFALRTSMIYTNT